MGLPRREATEEPIASRTLLQPVGCFIQDLFQEKLGWRGPVGKMFSRFMGACATEFSLKEKTEFIVQGVCQKNFELAKLRTCRLWKELSGYFARPEVRPDSPRS